MPCKPDATVDQPPGETALCVLFSHAHEPRHGCAIMSDVRAFGESRVVMSTGTLHDALKRRLGRGWVKRVDDVEEFRAGRGRSGHPRKAFAYTRPGRRSLEAEVGRSRRPVCVVEPRAVGGSA
jgi:DNA-binding PadR family transcriptional regulator